MFYSLCEYYYMPCPYVLLSNLYFTFILKFNCKYEKKNRVPKYVKLIYLVVN